MNKRNSEVRIILVGKTGAGKSATGNTILGKEQHFKAEADPEAVTEVCKEGAVKFGDRKVCVVDTPGILGSLDNDEMGRQMKKCVYMAAPGPHAFLLVISLAGRYTEEEKNAVKSIQENFGKKASMYTLILFTHTDQLEGKSLDEYVEKSKDLKSLITSCGGRYHGFNNKDRSNQTQVTELIGKIDKMVMGNGGENYTNEMFQNAQKEKDRLKNILKGVGAAAVGVAGFAAVVAGAILKR